MARAVRYASPPAVFFKNLDAAEMCEKHCFREVYHGSRRRLDESFLNQRYVASDTKTDRWGSNRS